MWVLVWRTRAIPSWRDSQTVASRATHALTAQEFLNPGRWDGCYYNYKSGLLFCLFGGCFNSHSMGRNGRGYPTIRFTFYNTYLRKDSLLWKLQVQNSIRVTFTCVTFIEIYLIKQTDWDVNQLHALIPYSFWREIVCQVSPGQQKTHHREKEDTHSGNVGSNVMPHSYYLTFSNYVLRK